MTFTELKEYLSCIGVVTDSLYLTGKEKKNHCIIQCPLAFYTHASGVDNHPSMMIWMDEDCTRYKCLSCGEQGKIWELFRDWGYHRNDKEVQALALKVLKVDTPTLESLFIKLGQKFEPEEKQDVTLWTIPQVVLQQYPSAFLDQECENYLLSRKVSEWTAAKFELCYDTKNHRVCFPVYEENRIVGLVGRTLPKYDTGRQRYYNYFEFLASETLGGSQFIGTYTYSKILVLEGYFDLLRCHEWCMELSILPLCTWKAATSVTQFYKLAKLDKPLVIGYDMDEAGTRGATKLITLGVHHGVIIKKRLELPADCDVGSLDKEQFINCFNKLQTLKDI